MPARVVTAADGVEVVVDGRRLVSFAGCDYLGLSRHPDVVAAARDALDRCGVGATASRTTTGTWLPHVDLEAALAKWMRTEDAVVLPSGYMAATALAVALAPDCDIVLLDDGAHPAVRDAAVATGLPVCKYPHFNGRAIRTGDLRPLILTDALDVATAGAAPIGLLRRVVNRNRGALVVDDAHGIGIRGTKGRGSTAQPLLNGARVHVAGSLSKALGAHGGFVTGTRRLCDAVRERFGGYAGGTPIAPATAAAALAAVGLASRNEKLRDRLNENAMTLRWGLRDRGVRMSSLPWLPLGADVVDDLEAASDTLADRGFLVPHVNYFGAPAGGYLKVVVTAAHSAEQIDALVAALRDVVRPAAPPVT